MNTRKNGLDRDKVIILGTIALLEAVGAMFLLMAIFNLTLADVDSANLVSFTSILTGGIWGFLLCRNC